ncbi:hypothetical protein BJV78DRAFT_800702 [Lactifluus subvellereus]|nr:hypothetical protein BJV78DRAFT_510386 [Lactifluus subvellereus]KAI0248337.1 hypothetical protein BJV78DRAFT_800702 [Lactifluus subvellereus]
MKTLAKKKHSGGLRGITSQASTCLSHFLVFDHCLSPSLRCLRRTWVIDLTGHWCTVAVPGHLARTGRLAGSPLQGGDGRREGSTRQGGGGRHEGSAHRGGSGRRVGSAQQEGSGRHVGSTQQGGSRRHGGSDLRGPGGEARLLVTGRLTVSAHQGGNGRLIVNAHRGGNNASRFLLKSRYKARCSLTNNNAKFFLPRSDLLQEAIATRFTREVEEDRPTPGSSSRGAYSDLVNYLRSICTTCR